MDGPPPQKNKKNMEITKRRKTPVTWSISGVLTGEGKYTTLLEIGCQWVLQLYFFCSMSARPAKRRYRRRGKFGEFLIG